MELTRYTATELKDILINLFYETMSSKDDKINMDSVHRKYETDLIRYESRLSILKEAFEKPSTSSCRNSLASQIGYIEEAIKHLKYGCKESQKQLKERTGSMDYSCSIVRIPLDKKINSYYDDLILEVLFYDDVATLNGRYKEFSKLTTIDDRFKFIVDNIEITHVALAYAPSNIIKAVVALEGKLNVGDERVESSGIELLDSKFADFKNLTLKDTLIIKNNDLRQYFQTKIDLDKENLNKLASVFIRGDKYEIYESTEVDYLTPIHSPALTDSPARTPIKVLLIRYTCRSTGRVYYNRLNLNNLRISPEFKEGDYESYCRAWWHLNTLGGDVDGKPVIRC